MSRNREPIDFLKIVKKAKKDIASESETNSGTPAQFARSFFRTWIQMHGHAYFFLFRKNLRITNIQFAELLALIRCQLTTKTRKHIHFYEWSDFIKEVQRLIETVLEGGELKELEGERFKQIYSEHLADTVVIDPLYGSCGVYVPSNLELDLKGVCAQSGYIQAAGPLVLLQPVDHYTKTALEQHLEMHLNKSRKKQRRPFVIYSHEDFPAKNLRQANDQQDGLGELKIHLNKFYIGSERLTSILDALASINKLRVFKPGEGKYSGQGSLRKLIRSEIKGCSSVLWLLIDHGIDLTGRAGVRIHPSESRYFVCYEQTITNRNPFHIFDEEKPGWEAPVTIPPTLAGAMINIARPHLRREKLSAYDPFCGSGTFLFEGIKFPDIDFCGSDLSEIACLITQDNFDIIIKKSCAEIEQLCSELQECQNTDVIWDVKKFIESKCVKRDEDSEIIISKRAVKDLRGRGILFRLLFYSWLRVYMEYISEPAGNPEAATDINNQGGSDHSQQKRKREYRYESMKTKGYQKNRLCDAINNLRTRLDELRKLRFNEERGDATEMREFRCFLDDVDYSKVVTLSSSYLKEKRLAVKSGGKWDISKLKENTKHDLVVTDPPYGINMPVRDLHEIYQKALQRMIQVLRRDGQLVFCVPMRSRTGRRIPYFIHPRFVIRLVLSAAAKENREVIGQMSPVPGSFGEMIRPPYYWEAPKSLRRAILQFRVQ
jgi:hypothetical protein